MACLAVLEWRALWRVTYPILPAAGRGTEGGKLAPHVLVVNRTITGSPATVTSRAVALGELAAPENWTLHTRHYHGCPCMSFARNALAFTLPLLIYQNLAS